MILSHAIKHHKVLYASGKCGKGGKWEEIATTLTDEHKMPFKANSIRDWIRDYLEKFNNSYKKHVIITGNEQNDDGKLSDAHQIDRACYDLIELKKNLQEVEQKKKKAVKDTKVEEEIRDVATKKMVDSKDVGVEYKKPPPSKSVREVVQQGQKNLESTMSEMLEIKQQKLKNEQEFQRDKLALKNDNF